MENLTLLGFSSLVRGCFLVVMYQFMLLLFLFLGVKWLCVIVECSSLSALVRRMKAAVAAAPMRFSCCGRDAMGDDSLRVRGYRDPGLGRFKKNLKRQLIEKANLGNYIGNCLGCIQYFSSFPCGSF